MNENQKTLVILGVVVAVLLVLVLVFTGGPSSPADDYQDWKECVDQVDRPELEDFGHEAIEDGEYDQAVSDYNDFRDECAGR